MLDRSLNYKLPGRDRKRTGDRNRQRINSYTPFEGDKIIRDKLKSLEDHIAPFGVPRDELQFEEYMAKDA